MDRDQTRNLIWISIIHSPVDLGSMSEAIRRLYIRQMGRNKWQRHHAAIEEFWIKVRESLEQYQLDFHRVRLYQDGLPQCGQEEKIVRDLNTAGSWNHKILLDLMERGAQLTGTESPQLLLEEYELSRQVLAAMERQRGSKLPPTLKDASHNLLEKRDAFIARRIAETLGPGETGLVFLGMLHSLEGKLPPDIQVTRLQPQGQATSASLPFSGEKAG